MVHRNTALSLILIILVIDYFKDSVAEKLTISPIIKRLLGYPNENLLNFADEAKANGYSAETHYVTTEDGYILQNFRMKSSKCKTYKTVPILLLHGLALNADVFLVAGKDAAIGYLLADECYDVWAINYRGNNYSRKHKILDPDNDPDFWDFSLDELSNYDNTAVIDYILETTKASKIHTIGFSMGGGTILLTLAGNPEYNKNIGVVIGLSPGVTLRKTKSIPVAIGLKVCYDLQNFLSDLGIKEILSKDSLVQAGLELVCQFSVMNSVCNGIIASVDTEHSKSISSGTIRRFFSTFPMGISVKLVAQGQQWAITEKLAPTKYNYDSEKNLMVYGSESPPAYDFSNISAPVVIVHGKADHVVTAEALNELVALISDVKLINVTDSLWNHLDMLYSQDSPTVIFPSIVDTLKQYND